MASVIVRVSASVFTIVAPLFIVIDSLVTFPRVVSPSTFKSPPNDVLPVPVTLRDPRFALPSISIDPLISKLVASISPDALKITPSLFPTLNIISFSVPKLIKLDVSLPTVKVLLIKEDIVVCELSMFNLFPSLVKPRLPSICPAPENWEKTIGVVPNIIDADEVNT